MIKIEIGPIILFVFCFGVVSNYLKHNNIVAVKS